jgi:branched-chain amino acid transport system substrate-binding protein
MRLTSRRRRIAVPVALVAVIATAVMTATAAGGKSAATPIKIGILSDCQGAFGAFDNQDLGGAVAALSEYAGAKPKNPNLPRAGIIGGSIGGHPLKLVGVGCSNDRADTAIKETRRLVEQLGADIQIGPLSGDESIAVANYAKAHPTKTFVNGTAAAQDTTLHVRAPNFFRFNSDGAQWNAGAGDYAYTNLHWKTAAIIMDDYSFAWTSAAGFIAEFCGVGGKITKRVFPPLNTTDYSSFVQQLPAPDKVDGYFWVVGGSGLIPSLKAFEQAYGPINGKQFAGNLFWGTPGSFQELGTRAAGAFGGGFGTAPDLKTPAAAKYSNIVGKWIKAMPPLKGTGKEQSGSGFVYNYFNNTWALVKALQAVNGDLSGGQKALQAALGKVELDSAYGHIKLDANRNAIADQYMGQLYLANGNLAFRTILKVPAVDQTFGGTFSAKSPSPGRSFPPCVKRSLPWVGHEKPVVNGVVK